jgi:hypothetical protein
MQKVLDVAQRQRIADLEQHGNTGHFGAGLEVPESAGTGHARRLGGRPVLLKRSSSDRACNRAIKHLPVPQLVLSTFPGQVQSAQPGENDGLAKPVAEIAEAVIAASGL